MKKNTKSLFLTMFSTLLLLGSASCSDTDLANGDGGQGGDETENVLNKKQAQKYEALSSLLGVVAEVDSLPSNWDKSDYAVEPTLGVVADEGNQHVRYVVTTSAEEADRVYRSMISADVSAVATNDAWSMEGIGSLNFKVLNQTDCYATLDVDVQQLPHLEQIRFVPSSAIGDNIAPKDDPYYGVGDVIRQKNGDETETYWVCVRPCSKAAAVRKSHWCTLQLNPYDCPTNPNYVKLTKKGKADIYLPTGLCKEKGDGERMVQNYFNVLRVLQRPDVYENATGIGEITKESGELSYDKVVSLCNMWEDLGIWDKLGKSNVVSGLLQKLNEEKPSLNAFYYGYNKVLWGDGDYRVYNMQLFTGNKGANKGMFTDVEKQKLWLSFSNQEVNFKSYEDEAGSKRISQLHDEDDGQSQLFTENQYIVKYKTGAQLEENKVFSTDNTVGQSFEARGNNYGITDVLAYKKLIDKKVESADDTPFYAFGDIAMPEAAHDISYFCIKDAGGDPEGMAYFVKASNCNSVLNAKLTTTPTALYITYQLLNAYLHETNKNISLPIDLDEYKDAYHACLSRLYEKLGKNKAVEFYEGVTEVDDGNGNKEQKFDGKYYAFANFFTSQDNLDDLNYVYPTSVCVMYDIKNNKFAYSIETEKDEKNDDAYFLFVDSYKDEYVYKENYSGGSLVVENYGKTRRYLKKNINSLYSQFKAKAEKVSSKQQMPKKGLKR